MNSIFIILYIESEEYYISFPKNESHSKNLFLQLSLSLSIYIYIYYWKNIFILYKLCATENRTKIYFYVLLEYVHF